MSNERKIKRALISLSDKAGIIDLVEVLSENGTEIISTGGTAKAIRDAGYKVTDVSDVTGFPEMMDGRVKTLHPRIHGGLLALRDDQAHLAAMAEHGIEAIDMAVINLYPFESTIAKEGVSIEEAIENIDIGGPAMIRSASKNWRHVAVVTDPRLYTEIIAELRGTHGSLSLKTRRRLAVLAYTRTAAYDLAISSFLAAQLDQGDLDRLEPLNPLGHLSFFETFDDAAGDDEVEELPAFATLELAKVTDLRYGENPHQRAALYEFGSRGGIAAAEQLQGKAMSFNNYVDAEAAWNLVQDLDSQGVAIIKHTNPSGVGLGSSNLEAYKRALATDPISAFGGIVAFNRRLDAEAAEAVVQVFTEVVLAPSFDEAALAIFHGKKNVRVLRVGGAGTENGFEYKQISGGMLVQDRDRHRLTASDLKVVTRRQPDPNELRAMMLAWTVCKHVRSNAIVLANSDGTIGVGAGQMNRVDSVRIAAMRAERFELPLEGSALASDAFFPFRDNVDEAARLGVSAVIQPGGSIKDDESIAAADEHGIAMAFTGIRHFKH